MGSVTTTLHLKTDISGVKGRVTFLVRVWRSVQSRQGSRVVEGRQLMSPLAGGMTATRRAPQLQPPRGGIRAYTSSAVRAH